MAAGGSAGARGRRAWEYVTELRRRYRAAYELAGRYEAAAEAERKLVATLLTLTARGWRLLVDRRWPGTRSANADMILIGPGGVFVLDVNRWHPAPVVADGHLLAGQEYKDAEVERLLAMTRTAERHVALLGMSPIALRPVLAFTGHRIDTSLGRVRLLGERELLPALVAEPRRLTLAMVRAVAAHLGEAFPAYEAPVLGRAPADGRPRTGAPADGRPPPGGTDPLFGAEEVNQAALRSALSAPIERWMTFLHPDQLALVRRNLSGPACINGPTGTGKTVVGLHRTAYLAERSTGRILYVTFVNNLPRVRRTLYRRLSPATVHRVEFTNLHAWAQAFLAGRGIESPLSGKWADNAFYRAWMYAGRNSPLVEVDPSPTYWKEEIDYVIKGRGLTSLAEYRVVARHGRRTALQAAHREAAWLLYEEYELLRAERGVHDFNDVLSTALAELRARPMDPPYTAVVVDEAQDLTLVGVKLLHALVGDAPNGLLLIGDGQQAVYPGGFRLADAGIAVKGRGGMLRTNYRNATPILHHALDMISGDPFDDLEETSPHGRREVESVYHDGRVVTACAADEGEHDRLLVEALRALPRSLSDAAVLCATYKQRDRYERFLTRAGFSVLRLENYHGDPVEAVKLGTYRRAKGLEFKYVFLPCHDTATRIVQTARATDRERLELLRRQLFVAMTRARDLLWLGSVTKALHRTRETG